MSDSFAPQIPTIRELPRDRDSRRTEIRFQGEKTYLIEVSVLTACRVRAGGSNIHQHVRSTAAEECKVAAHDIAAQGRSHMAIAKTIEVIASSTQGIEAAVREGINKVGETVENIEGAWVKDTKVVVRDGGIAEWRVTMVVTFIVK